MKDVIRTLKRRGFTIVELIVIITVIAILASITVLGYSSVQKNARDKALLSDIDAVAGLETNYSLRNGGAPQAWFSGNGASSDINFTPSKGNVVDVATAGTMYCIRAYNTAANKNSITNAYSQGSTPEACDLIDASTAAGGTGGKVVGWWQLNGNAVDSSGGGHNGTVSGATPTTGQNGMTNGAYTFSSTATQSIDTGYNFPLNTLSVSMWINWSGNSAGSYGTLISNTRDTGGPYNGFQMHIAKSSSAMGTRLWYGSTYSGMTYSTIPTGVWTHVVLTYNGQTSMLYINGVQAKTASFAQVLGASAYNVFIGRGGWTNGYGFGGDIDDVRIYDYGLSAATVKAIYDRGAL